MRFFPAFSRAAGKNSGSHREVLGLRVVEDDGGGRLLRVELVFFGEGDADLIGVEQRQELLLVGEVGAGGVAEGVAAVALARQPHFAGTI